MSVGKAAYKCHFLPQFPSSEEFFPHGCSRRHSSGSEEQRGSDRWSGSGLGPAIECAGRCKPGQFRKFNGISLRLRWNEKRIKLEKSAREVIEGCPAARGGRWRGVVNVGSPTCSVGVGCLKSWMGSLGGSDPVTSAAPLDRGEESK